MSSTAARGVQLANRIKPERGVENHVYLPAKNDTGPGP